jgi:hypothetical protein
MKDLPGQGMPAVAFVPGFRIGGLLLVISNRSGALAMISVITIMVLSFFRYRCLDPDSKKISEADCRSRYGLDSCHPDHPWCRGCLTVFNTVAVS